MPFKAQEVSKCPKCGKSVYAAEEMVAGGYKWHKFCFKCSLCGKMLDSVNCCEHGTDLFCKKCYGRVHGPKGVGWGIGGGCLSMDTGEQFGNTESTMTNRPRTDEIFALNQNANVVPTQQPPQMAHNGHTAAAQNLPK